MRHALTRRRMAPLAVGMFTFACLTAVAPRAEAANLINVGGTQQSGAGGGLLGGLNAINALGTQSTGSNGGLLGGVNAINVGGTQQSCSGANLINVLGAQSSC